MLAQDQTDIERAIAEDLLWALLRASHSETVKKLANNCTADASNEILRELHAELRRKTSLGRLLRQRLEVLTLWQGSQRQDAAGLAP